MSVLWAERIVATRSWRGSSQWSSVFASGYSFLRRAMTSPIGAGVRFDLSAEDVTTVGDYILAGGPPDNSWSVRPGHFETFGRDNRDIRPDSHRYYFLYESPSRGSILVSVRKSCTGESEDRDG